MNTSSGSPATRLAAEFSRLIREGFPEHLVVIRARNRMLDQHVCATHDFCDANMVMAEAFKNVFGREVDINDDADTDLWNTAWDLAKAKGFAE